MAAAALVLARRGCRGRRREAVLTDPRVPGPDGGRRRPRRRPRRRGPSSTTPTPPRRSGPRCAALRPTTPGSLVCVTGAGGDRDRDKRHAMGAAAAEVADLVVVTDDNPRSEDPAAIRAAILEGVEAVARRAGATLEVLVVGDRREAIRAAVGAVWAQGTAATVAVVGKGHESGQDVGGVVHPFDDRDELRGGAAPRRARRAPRDRAVARRGRARSPAGSVVAPPGVDPRCAGRRRAGRHRLARGRPRRALRRPGRRARRRARLRRRRRVERGAVAALVTRPVEGVPCVVVADTQEAFAALAREVVRRLPGAGRRRHHRLLRQDEHQGPPRRRARPRPGRPSRPVGLVQLRGGRAAHRLPGHRRHAVPRRRDGRARHRPHRLPRPDGAARGSASCSTSAPRTSASSGRARRSPRAKSELVAALPADGLAVLNADDAAVRADGRGHDCPGRPRRRGRRRRRARRRDVVLDAGGRAVVHRRTPRRARRRRAPRARRRATTSATPSRWWPSPPSSGCRSSRSVPHWSPHVPVSRWRMEVTERADGVTVVNDAYNANPDSMRAALTALERMGEGAPHLGRARHDARARRRVRRPARRGRCRGRRPRCRRARRRGSRPRRRWRPGRARPRPPRHPASGRSGPDECARSPDADAAEALLARRARGPATWCCSSRAATPGYGCSVTDWPGRGRS